MVGHKFDKFTTGKKDWDTLIVWVVRITIYLFV